MGDGDAPGFFHVDSTTGRVSVKKLLYPGRATSYRLRIEAADNGLPLKKNEMTLYITVKRSSNPPRFNGAPYPQKTIDQTYKVDTIITQVKAHDPDSVGGSGGSADIRFSIIGDYPAPSFFKIDEKTGEIKVKESLTKDNLKSTQYLVRKIF